MFIGDLGRMTADQEAIFRQLKRWYKAQRKAMKKAGASDDELRAANLNRKSRHKALQELRKRFKAGESPGDLLAPSFDEVAQRADDAAKAELDAEAKSPIDFTALALAAGAAYLLT